MRRFLFIIVLSTTVAAAYGTGDIQTILVLPFQNAGSLEYEHICSQITMYNYSLIKETKGFNVIHPYKVKSTLFEMGYTIAHLEDSQVLKKLADRFRAVYVIGGIFSVKDKEFSAFMYIKKEKAGVFTIVSSDFVRSNIDNLIINTFDSLFLPILSTITGENIQSAFFTVQTDTICNLFINDVYFSQTPVRTKLRAGEHRIKIVHGTGLSGTAVYDSIITIAPNEDRVINLQVFNKITITSARECEVYIDYKNCGTTPYSGNLYSGNDYLLKLVYTNDAGKEVVVEDTIIRIKGGDEVILDYPDTGTITITGAPPFFGNIGHGTSMPLPYSFTLLKPGEYRIRAIVEDEDRMKEWIFYDKVHTLAPFSDSVIDMSSLSFKKRIGLCFIPSAAQFHNHEKTKGRILASMFGGSLITAGVSFVFAAIAHSDLEEMSDAFNVPGVGSGYTYEDIFEKQNIVRTGWGITAGALITAGVVYVYSLIDGSVRMNHLEKLVNEGSE